MDIFDRDFYSMSSGFALIVVLMLLVISAVSYFGFQTKPTPAAVQVATTE